MKRILLLALFSFAGSFQLFAQVGESWSVNYTSNKSFIENKGQFDAFANPSTGRIQYAIDFGFSRIFFGEKGVTYSFRQVKKKTREEREAIMSAGAPSFAEHKQMERLVGKFMVRQDEVNMTWGAASNAPKISGIHPRSDYHGYSYTAADGSSAHVGQVKGFEKLIYTDVFPNIDVEYTVHPEVGVKYAFILHPGADPKDIEMIYDREVVLEGGEIRIASLFGDIIDHAPITFYQGNNEEQVESKYLLNGRKVSFHLAKYDSERTLILDPWVQTPNDPNSNWDVVWELDKDAAGNVYVIAGIMPMRLLKYNSTGTLQWTHNTPYDTTAWLGTMATDNLGNSYVTNGTDYMIQKIDAAGNLVWNNNNPSGGQISTEFWNISFNCDQTKLLIGGTGGNLDIHGRVYDVNMNNGNIISSVAITSAGNLFSIPPSIQEVRAMCPAPNGKYYFVTLDTVGYLNDNLNLCPGGSSSLFRRNSGIGWGYKSENYRYNNTGIKAIRADENFLYIHRGNQLQKRSLVDASIIATANIPNGTFQNVFLGGNQNHNAGIDIDDCGNIYVGATTGVRKFDQNLNLLASYATTFNVYDVRVSTNGDIIACGGTGNSSSSNRSGGIQSFAASACVPISFTCCDATICIPQSICESDAPITLTTATGGGTWSGPGVNASGVFDPGVTGAGTFTITYTLACGSESISMTVDPCATIDICQETNGSLTASNGSGTYTWYTGTVNPPSTISNEAQCIACPTATPQYVGFPPFQFYTGCSISTCPGDTTWTQYATGVTTAPPSAYPIQVVDGNGTTITITNVSQIVPCTTNPCSGVTITVAASAQTNPSCFGGSNGTATAAASGGASPYTYIWSPGSLSGATQTTLSAGTYTVTAQDQNGCTGAGSIVIGSPNELVASAVSTAASCGASNGTATGSAIGGTGSYSYAWSPSGGNNALATGLTAGVYTVTVTDQNGCTDAATTTVATTSGPSLSLSTSTNVSCNGGNNGSATVAASGGTPGYTYAWSPGGLSGPTQTGLTATTYTVTVTDGTGCTATLNVPITQPTALSIAASNLISANCGLADGGATVTASGGSPNYSYAWSPAGSGTVSSNLAAGAYTVTVTDQNGCTANVNFGIATLSGPTLSLTASSDVSCNGGNDGSATVSASGGAPGYTYTWNPGGLTGATQTALPANTYSVTVTDAGGCVAVLNVLISEPPALSISTTSITDASCGASDGSATVAAVGGTGSYTYSWSPTGSGTTSNNLASGAYSVTVTDQNNCSASVSFNIGNTGGPTASLQSSSDVSCNGAADGSATVSVSGGTAPYSYNWSPNGGSAATASGLSGGSYTVTVTDDAGCTSTVNITILEPSALVLSETITDENCGLNDGGISVVASGGAGAYIYGWNPSAGNIPTLTGIGAGNYSLTVTDADGCSITENYLVQSTGGIPVDASPESTTIFSGESVQLFATGASSYEWTPTTGLDCSNCANPLASPTITTTYIVIGTDPNGCTGSDTLTIFVEETCGDLYVPTIFSPNGTGPTANETLCIYGNCITELNYAVYNRWGELVFQTNSTDICWDGEFKGKPAMSGVYAYKLYVLLNNGEVIENSGNVTLVR